jgi:hypothetical protein
MPSRCDFANAFWLVTSDWHPRLLHGVALRLKLNGKGAGGRGQGAGGRGQGAGGSVLRLNCEAMPCESLGHQSEEPVQRKRQSCKATAGVPHGSKTAIQPPDLYSYSKAKLCTCNSHPRSELAQTIHHKKSHPNSRKPKIDQHLQIQPTDGWPRNRPASPPRNTSPPLDDR